ncbi:MAG: glutathione S-transferase family protein [Usitatibacter sp.]
MRKPLLIGCKGCGNVIVESALAAAGIPYDYEEVDYAADSPTRARLLCVNPLGQVPAMVLHDGTVLTESLAMLHYVDDLAPEAKLVPARGDPLRPVFYRWAVFIVAAVYPTFTYGDDASKWVANEEGARQLRESTNRHREGLWRQLEAEAKGPWFLGERMSALDLYIAAMTYWRPGRRWFEASAPKLFAISQKASATPGLADVMKRNFS